jgi:hypothetical protein
MSDFSKEIEKGIRLMCGKIGFQKKEHLFIKPIDEYTIATLGFGMALHQEKGHIFVDVTVGVLHKKVEELSFKLSVFDKPHIKPTVSSQIGYIMPESIYKTWDFAENANNAPVFQDLLMHIQSQAFRYQEKMKDFNNLFTDTLNKKHHANIYKILSILYYLKGEKAEGRTVIEDALEREKERVAKYECPAQPFNLANNIVFGKEMTDNEKKKFEKEYKKLFTPKIMEQAQQSKKEYVNANFIDTKYGRISKELLTFIEQYDALPPILDN